MIAVRGKTIPEFEEELGRFGQVTVSSGGRLVQPTNVVAPGPAAIALQAQRID